MLNRDVEGAAAAHQRLLADVDGLDPASHDLDPSRPTALAGWTVGHLLTHIARQADSVVRMLDGVSQYEGGAQGRSAEIEAGATRERHALITDVRMSIWRLESRWAAHENWEAPAILVSGAVVACHELPFRRWREVAIQALVNGTQLAINDRTQLRATFMIWRSAITLGLLSIGGSIGWTLAMTLENAAKVRTLGQVELLIAFAIARISLGERHSTRDYAATALVSAGIVIVAVLG